MKFPKIAIVAALGVSMLSLGACTHYGAKQTGGTLLGAGLGGLLGKKKQPKPQPKPKSTPDSKATSKPIPFTVNKSSDSSRIGSE